MRSRLEGLSAALIQHVVAAAQALDAGRADDAQHRLDAALATRPDHPEILRLQAGIHSLRGNPGDALAAIQRAVAQRPDDALYHNTLGTILGAAGEFDAAIAALRRACELQPGLATAWYNLGILLTRCVRYPEAVDALRTAVVLVPDHVLARAQLADMLRVSDRIDEAVVEYRRVLAEQPWVGMAWWGLADIKTMRFTADDIERMRAAMHDTRASDDDSIATGFALAKALDDAGCYADSLSAIAAANTIARRRQTWNAAAFSGFVDAIDVALAPAHAAGADAAGLGREVIFVVSLPRSGSTLVEQILASHSQVEGAGELPDLALTISEESQRRGKIFPQWTGELQAEDWARLGRRYLQRTAHWRQRGAIFVDKMPHNWVYIGAIRAMLPGARIVCARRDRLETCLACYRQHFAGNEYTRTFVDLAAYWRDFDRSVRQWRGRAPLRVYEHIYEDLLADTESSIRKLLDFCGLPFEEACLRFHETRRDVRSPSATQVRQPLRQDTARALRYGNALDPLRAALGMSPFVEPTHAA